MILKKKAKVYCILQLCVVFTVLCGYLAYPFLGEVFSFKKLEAPYLFLRGENNLNRFEMLSSEEKEKLALGESNLKTRLNRPYFQKLKDALYIFIEVSPLKTVWILLGVILPLLILLQIRGAISAIWLLPVIAVAFAFENITWGVPQQEDPDEKLFPSEKYLIQNYLDGKFPLSVLEEKTALEKGFKKYLKAEWGNGNNDDGAFNFILARIQAREKVNYLQKTDWRQKEPLIFLLIFVAWNFLIAWRVAKIKLTETDIQQYQQNS